MSKPACEKYSSWRPTTSTRAAGQRSGVRANNRNGTWALTKTRLGIVRLRVVLVEDVGGHVRGGALVNHVVYRGRSFECRFGKMDLCSIYSQSRQSRRVKHEDKCIGSAPSHNAPGRSMRAERTWWARDANTRCLTELAVGGKRGNGDVDGRRGRRGFIAASSHIH